MTQDEVLKLALEALEEAWYHVGTFQPTEKAIDLYDEARTAIKEALAQPEQEPVAWRWGVPKLKNNDFEWRYSLNKTRPDAIPLYTTPPQRTWVGLTEDEIKECFQITSDQYLPAQIYKRIEAKLKEKNAEKN